ncbi:MAG: hypothetical protein II779_13780, partial [Clostridia bacterium]|nr:hypothetical protein [Clostridia bacterium]
LCDRVIPLVSDSQAAEDPDSVGRANAELNRQPGPAAQTVEIPSAPTDPMPPAPDRTPAPRETGAVPAVPSKIFLRAPSEHSSEFKRARALCLIFPGSVPAVFYSSETREYLKPPLSVKPTPLVLGELREMLGEENVVLR